MDITTSIVPRKSLGGISIGEQIDDVIARLSNTYLIYKTINCTTINDGLITAYHDDEGLISSLSCNSKFKGNFQKKIWPGMTVADVMKNTSSQVAWSGFVQVDRIGGVGLSLPNELDDFERLTDDLDDSYVFEELWVYE
jgi:hypothetical protein